METYTQKRSPKIPSDDLFAYFIHPGQVSSVTVSQCFLNFFFFFCFPLKADGVSTLTLLFDPKVCISPVK